MYPKFRCRCDLNSLIFKWGKSKSSIKLHVGREQSRAIFISEELLSLKNMLHDYDICQIRIMPFQK